MTDAASSRLFRLRRKVGRVEDAVSMIVKMIGEGFCPDLQAINGVMVACGRVSSGCSLQRGVGYSGSKRNLFPKSTCMTRLLYSHPRRCNDASLCSGE